MFIYQKCFLMNTLFCHENFRFSITPISCPGDLSTGDKRSEPQVSFAKDYYDNFTIIESTTFRKDFLNVLFSIIFVKKLDTAAPKLYHWRIKKGRVTHACREGMQIFHIVTASFYCLLSHRSFRLPLSNVDKVIQIINFLLKGVVP